MRYILKEAEHSIDHRGYCGYLATVEKEMDPGIYGFASNSAHFDLSSPGSLHDAWLQDLSVTESRGDDSNGSSVLVRISLLGPHHDRMIDFEYQGVSEYSFTKLGTGASSVGLPTGHGDVFTHEIRMEAGVYEHEILFVKGHRFIVKFRAFIHREHLI